MLDNAALVTGLAQFLKTEIRKGITMRSRKHQKALGSCVPSSYHHCVRKATGQLSKAEPTEEGSEGRAAPSQTPSAVSGKALPQGDKTKSIKTQRNDSKGKAIFPTQ